MKLVGHIYEAEATDKFTLLDGNRAIDEKRMNRIKRSIENIGVRKSAPIIVNNDFQIIDGQARYMTCVKEGLPIYFTVDEEAGLRECIAMNISSTNWSTLDYIHSYAAQGRKDYIELEKKCKSRKIAPTIIASVCYDIYGYRNVAPKVKDGTFKIRDTDERIEGCLDFFELISDEVVAIGGRTEATYMALQWLWKESGIDIGRLVETMRDLAEEAEYKHHKVSTVEQALAIIEKKYNKYLRQKNAVYIVTDYKKYMATNRDGYASRYKINSDGGTKNENNA